QLPRDQRYCTRAARLLEEALGEFHLDDLVEDGRTPMPVPEAFIVLNAVWEHCVGGPARLQKRLDPEQDHEQHEADREDSQARCEAAGEPITGPVPTDQAEDEGEERGDERDEARDERRPDEVLRRDDDGLDLPNGSALHRSSPQPKGLTT